MQHNQVYELVDLLEGFKPIDCKWVFKIKKVFKGKIDQYKARLFVKGFTHRVITNYTYNFTCFFIGFFLNNYCLSCLF